MALVGCGATGSALASLLARAGVGSIRIIDRDYVEPSNLQRQSLFDEADAAEALPKAIAAARKILPLTPRLWLNRRSATSSPPTLRPCWTGCELVLDGTDNFETRYLINDFAVKNFPPLDLHRCGRQLWHHHERAAGRDRLPGLSFSRSAAGSVRDL